MCWLNNSQETLASIFLLAARVAGVVGILNEWMCASDSVSPSPLPFPLSYKRLRELAEILPNTHLLKDMAIAPHKGQYFFFNCTSSLDKAELMGLFHST